METNYPMIVHWIMEFILDLLRLTFGMKIPATSILPPFLSLSISPLAG
jgi:hypothetical protein